MGQDETDRWQESLTHTLDALVSQIIALTPQLIGALLLLAAGWLVAHVLRTVTHKLVRGLDVLFQSATARDDTARKGSESAYATIISRCVFWIVIVFFVAATGNWLGLGMFSTWMATVVAYLPNLMTGLLIILAGFLFGNGARTAVNRAAGSFGLAQRETLARIAQTVIVFTAMVIGLKQIGINVDFLTDVLMVVIGVLLLGGALAFSLGARDLVANIIGAQYVRKHCRLGERMHIGDIEGLVIEVTQTSILLETDVGRTIVPAKHFQEQITSFSTGYEDAPGQPSPENEGQQ